MNKKVITILSCVLIIVIGLVCFQFLKQPVKWTSPKTNLSNVKNAESGANELIAEETQDKLQNQNKEDVIGRTKVIFADDQLLKSTGIFYLGMTKDDLYKKINEQNIKIVRDYNHGSEGSSVYCECVVFFLGPDNKVKEMTVNDKCDFSTTKGLKIGDSLEKAEQVYGSDYEFHEEPDANVYEYRFSSNKFFLIFNSDNNLLSGWGISNL